MDDPSYKRLFSRPRMVEDLLHGFAARDWSGALDFASLAPLPASHVSHDLRQRHGDLVWRVRFHDEQWLYLVLHLEFQSTVDRAMAVRMLTMLAEQVQEWTAEWVEEGREQGIAQGREQGIAQGRAEERALLCRQAERKFDAATARRLAAALEDVADPDRLTEVGDWIIECGTGADLLARISDERRRGA